MGPGTFAWRQLLAFRPIPTGALAEPAD